MSTQLIAFGIALLIPELAMIVMIWRQDKDRPSKAATRRARLQIGRPRGKSV